MKPKLPRQGTTQLYSDPTATTSSVRTQLSSSSTVTRVSSVTRLSKSSSVTRSSSQVSRRPSLRTSVSSQPQIQKSQTQEVSVTQRTLSKSGSQASVTDQIKENGSVLHRKSSTVSRKSSLTPARTTSTTLKMKRKASSSAKLAPVANKRARKAPTRFANLEEKQSPVKRKAPNEEQKILHYRKGDFLAVKSDEDDEGFYLCKAIQNVFKSTKQFMIQWLNKDDNTGHYSADYCDFTELDCIIVEVKLDRQGRGVYSLPAQELSRIQNALQGQLSDEEEEESVDEPKVKKAKLVKVKQGEKKVKTKAGEPKVKKMKEKEKVKKEKKEKVKKEKKEKPKKEKKVRPPKPVKRKGPNRKLVPNPNITVLDQDPLYYSRDRVPFISPQAHSKLVFRAVFLKDKKLLKEFINDIKSVSTVSSNRSGEIQQSPLNYAIKMRDLEAATMLIKEQTKHRSKPSELRIVPNPVLLHTISTGSYNPKSLGIPAIRPLAMSRGCREGNNAFSKDPNINYFSVHNEIRMALIEGSDLDFINKMLIAANQTDRYQLSANVHYAVRAGHRKLAGRIIEEAEKTLGPANFNFLHKEVLLFNSEDLRPLRAASVMKKAGNNDCMLPIHCACINPNVKYLSALMSVCPEYDMPDKRNRRPVHYAAACETTATLEYLVSHGARTEEFDTAGMTPLMIACETGRMHNVEFLLKKAKESSEKPEDEGVAVTTNKFGIGQINRPNKQSYTALHIAIKNGRLDMMKKLLEYGADIKRKLSAGKNRMTSLMIAREVGDFEIIKYLNELNVPIEQTDKLGRTQL